MWNPCFNALEGITYLQTQLIFILNTKVNLVNIENIWTFLMFNKYIKFYVK